MSNVELVERLVGFSWFIGFPIVVFLMDSYFKKRNNENRLPQVFVSGVIFYIFGCYFAFSLIK